jgi:hypothetical protein
MSDPAVARRDRIPLAIKLAFTVFMAVLVPVYSYHYGPFVMLYFCDVALVLTLVALWWESPLFASMAAVGVLLGQLMWILDVATGTQYVGLAAYMFDDTYPLFGRILSLFHAWLPLLMIWVLSRLGYDRRAFFCYTVLAWVLLVVSYLFLPGPPGDPSRPLYSYNVNYVYGLGSTPHPWGPWWFALLLVLFPLGFYLPTHLTLRALFRNPRASKLHDPTPTPDGLALEERLDTL